MGHRMVVKTYFANAMGLRAGAPVRFAGVDLGSVKSERAKPEVKNSPVEVVMVFNPPYELKIPNDSTVLLETAVILGETFVDIDAGECHRSTERSKRCSKNQANSAANHGTVHRKAERSFGEEKLRL
jgi:ABC-type transporter Mla subunit MlaD